MAQIPMRIQDMPFQRQASVMEVSLTISYPLMPSLMSPIEVLETPFFFTAYDPITKMMSSCTDPFVVHYRDYFEMTFLISTCSALVRRSLLHSLHPKPIKNHSLFSVQFRMPSPRRFKHQKYHRHLVRLPCACPQYPASIPPSASVSA